MLNKTSTINLAKKKIDFFDVFLKWALTAGRIIIIITEVIALSAFLYRFSLDRQLIDLHDTIKQKQTIVNNFKTNEDKYRNLQERLAFASQFGNEGQRKVKLFRDIIGFATPDLIFNSLLLSEDAIRMEIRVRSLSPLSKFVNALRNYSLIKTISVDKIENRTSIGIIAVTITATLKNGQISAKQIGEAGEIE